MSSVKQSKKPIPQTIIENTQTYLAAIGALAISIAAAYVLGFFYTLNFNFMSALPLSEYVSVSIKSIPYAIVLIFANVFLDPFDTKSNNEEMKKSLSYKAYRQRSTARKNAPFIVLSIVLTIMAYKLDNDSSELIYGYAIYNIVMISHHSFLEYYGIEEWHSKFWRGVFFSVVMIVMAAYGGLWDAKGRLFSDNPVTLERDGKETRANLLSMWSTGYLLYNKEKEELIYVNSDGALSIRKPFKFEEWGSAARSITESLCNHLGAYQGTCYRILAPGVW